MAAVPEVLSKVAVPELSEKGIEAVWKYSSAESDRPSYEIHKVKIATSLSVDYYLICKIHSWEFNSSYIFLCLIRYASPIIPRSFMYSLAILLYQLPDCGIPREFFVWKHICRIPYPGFTFENCLYDFSFGCGSYHPHISPDYFWNRSDICRQKWLFHRYAFRMHGTESLRQWWSYHHIWTCYQCTKLIFFKTIKNLHGCSEMIFSYLLLNIFCPLGIYEIEYKQ